MLKPEVDLIPRVPKEISGGSKNTTETAILKMGRKTIHDVHNEKYSVVRKLNMDDN